MNENFHQSLEDKCHRMLNAVERGTVVAIHRRVAKDECFVVLRGKVGVTTHNDDGGVIEEVGGEGREGLLWGRMKKDVRDKLESLESGCVIFECKEGAVGEHEQEGILELPKK